VEERVPRPWAEKAKRKMLRRAMLSPLFGPAMRLGQAVRGVLPESLKRKVPERRAAGALPQVEGHTRQVLMLAGCVQ
ncbi:glycolate oxidase subunit GlcF, partial [Pseudomonas aeruginosa]